ncbi:MAG: TIGR03067 domain-containing protein [Planctomycetes bacterium]|nr:TIGR03067 domain-containing protein [Planctomycetota bacterium]
MRTMLICSLTLACILIAATAAPGRAGELDGAWDGHTLVTMQGTQADDFAKTIRWVIEGEKFTLVSGERTTEGKITIDEKATPKSIDVYASKGTGPQVEVGGIYKLDGETLTVCYYTRKGSRPKEYQGGDEKILLTLKKKKS